MKTVILCGGRGTRLGEKGVKVPKALFPIGSQPLIWHLLKIYSCHEIKNFVLCLGFLGDQIRQYFDELSMPTDSDGSSRHNENWHLDFIDTGLDTNTGGRIKRIENLLADEEDFCVTYGDGLADVDVSALIDFHRAHGKIATLTAVHPRSNFGIVKLNDDDSIHSFVEKPILKDWINGGFFVFNRRIFDYLEADSILEREPLERLAQENELMAFRHQGFWKCMDTFKDTMEFNSLWNNGEAAWKIWD